MNDGTDPLVSRQDPDRVFYDEGVLLDAADFLAEQTYHRGRLARALAFLHGSGTVAGLRVHLDPPDPPSAAPGSVEQLVVEPGLAIDRFGRLIELPRPACIRLQRWLDARDDDALLQALHLGGQAAEVDGARLDGVVADLFVRFVACERGKTPAFATGPFDALDAVVPARLRDGYALELRLRTGGLPTPQGHWPPDRAQLHDAIFAAWDRAAARDARGKLEPLPEHLPGQDTTSLFLARVVIPASQPAPGERVARSPGAPVAILNELRPFVYTAGALASVTGL